MASNLAQDFIFGVDPFGIYTSQYGQQAERARLSEGQHKLKQLATTSGGLLGGAVITPSVLVGGARAIQGAMGAKGGGRLAAAAKGFAKGVKEPVQAMTDITRVQMALRRAKKGGRTKLTQRERDSVKRLSQEVRVTDVLGTMMNPLSSISGAKALRSGVLTRRSAQALSGPMGKASLMVGVPLVGGGAIGSLGAGIQYAKGRETERDYQRRNAMQKMSSVEGSALQAAYSIEMDKIAKSKGLGYGFGQIAGKLHREVEKIRNLPSDIYENYARGFYARTPKESLKDLAKDLKNLDMGTLAVPAMVGVGGTAAGLALGSALSNR